MRKGCVKLANAWLRLLHCESGSNAVEFAFMFPVFAALMLITFQVAIIYTAGAYLETVSEAGARLVMTNQAGTAGWTASQFQTQICAQISALFNCSNLIVSLELAPSSASGMAAAMPQFNADGSLQTSSTAYALSSAVAPAKMMLVVMYQWPVIGMPSMGFNFSNMGNGTFLLVSTQVFQVEPS